MTYDSLAVIEAAVSGVDGPTIARLFLPHPPLAAQRLDEGSSESSAFPVPSAPFTLVYSHRYT